MTGSVSDLVGSWAPLYLAAKVAFLLVLIPLVRRGWERLDDRQAGGSKRKRERLRREMEERVRKHRETGVWEP